MHDAISKFCECTTVLDFDGSGHKASTTNATHSKTLTIYMSFYMNLAKSNIPNAPRSATKFNIEIKKEQDRRVKIVQNNKCILNVNFQQCKYNQFYDQIMRVG